MAQLLVVDDEPQGHSVSEAADGQDALDQLDMDFDPGSNLVEVCLRRLRLKLQPDLPMETVRGGGYCFSDN